MDNEALTHAQKRVLAEVRVTGRRIYNGRARRPVEALEAAGLVSVDWDMVPHVKGNGIELTWRITVTLPHESIQCPEEHARREWLRHLPL